MALAPSKRLGGLSMAADETHIDSMPETGLLLVGMGMGRMEGMTIEALEAATIADHRRYEAYTALWPEEELIRLEAAIGPVERVMRPEVEEPQELLALAKTSLVALLVVGDPLQATTHVDLQLRAKEAGVACRVFHGVSITSLVTGAAGLSNYKFGRQTTSPLEVLAANWGQHLHTLALLDLDPTGQGVGDQRPMTPADAVRSLRAMWGKLAEKDEDDSEDSSGESAVRRSVQAAYLDRSLDDVSVVLCSDMGTPQQRIVSTTVGALSDEPGGRLNCLLFPAITGEVEEKALARWRRSA
jgi:diphthamide biosynthesis methyltransferase